MSRILNTIALYLILVVIVRISGRRTLSEMTTFDFILLLIISEATQQALTGDDFSLTTAILTIVTLVGVDILFSLLQMRSKTLEKWMDGTPTVLVDNGKVLAARLQKNRISEAEILEAARRLQGLERMDQIKYAVLEKSGGITVVPQ